MLDIVDNSISTHTALIEVVASSVSLCVGEVHKELSGFHAIGVYKSPNGSVLFLGRLNAGGNVNTGAFRHDPDVAVTHESVKRSSPLSGLVDLSDFAMISVSVVALPSRKVKEFTVRQQIPSLVEVGRCLK